MGGGANQLVEASVLGLEVGRADREEPSTPAGGQRELVEAAIGVARRHELSVAQQPGQVPGEAVVEDDTELCGPSAGQAQVPRLVQAVRRPPGWRRHRQHRVADEAGIIQWDRVPERGPVGAAAPEPAPKAGRVAIVDELGQRVRQHGWWYPTRGSLEHGGEPCPNLDRQGWCPGRAGPGSAPLSVTSISATAAAAARSPACSHSSA